MSVPVEIERKVRQHDNDIGSIYEMLTAIADDLHKHGDRLTVLDGKLDEVLDLLRNGGRG
jgi:hypothetical protein